MAIRMIRTGHSASDLRREAARAKKARVGQKGTLTRLWARKGTHPGAPKHCRYARAFARSIETVAFAGSRLCGAVCPVRATGAAPVVPHARTEPMNALTAVSQPLASYRFRLIASAGAG